MDKEFYDKYAEGLKCYGCNYLIRCKKADRPILEKCIPNMNYVDEIIGLKTKLAESEVIIKGGKEEIKDLHRKINEIVERDMNCIQQLKQQLAEKDEYIKYNIPKLIEANEMMSKNYKIK